MAKCKHDTEWNLEEITQGGINHVFTRGELSHNLAQIETTGGIVFMCFTCGLTKRCTVHDAPKWMRPLLLKSGIRQTRLVRTDFKL